jgi:hypothetical protein
MLATKHSFAPIYISSSAPHSERTGEFSYDQIIRLGMCLAKGGHLFHRTTSKTALCHFLVTILLIRQQSTQSWTEGRGRLGRGIVVSPLRVYSPDAESPLRASIGRASAPDQDEEGVSDLRCKTNFQTGQTGSWRRSYGRCPGWRRPHDRNPGWRSGRCSCDRCPGRLPCWMLSATAT